MADWWTTFFNADYLRIYKDRAEKAPDEADFVRQMLGLKRGQHVLDICCGYGRHAIPLAKAGLNLTGFDMSQFFLDKARRDARRHKVKIAWQQGDVRTMSFTPTYDAAINLFTSFGYFETDEENYQLIGRTAAALKPGGKFMLDTINREHVISNHEPRRWQQTGRGILIENSTIDWVTGRMHSKRTLILPGRPKSRREFYLRLYTLAETAGMFERAGLEVTHTLGAYDDTEYSPSTARMIIIGQKPK